MSIFEIFLMVLMSKGRIPLYPHITTIVLNPGGLDTSSLLCLGALGVRQRGYSSYYLYLSSV